MEDSGYGESIGGLKGQGSERTKRVEWKAKNTTDR